MQGILIIIQISQRKVVVYQEVCGIINGVVYSLFVRLSRKWADDVTSQMVLNHGGSLAIVTQQNQSCVQR